MLWIGPTLSADEADVGIGMVTVARIAQGEPLAVGDPADLAAGEVQNHQPASFFDKGQFLSVGGVLRACPVGFPGFEQRFFFEDRRIRKIGIFVPNDRRRIYVPITVAFRSVRLSAAKTGLSPASMDVVMRRAVL